MSDEYSNFMAQYECMRCKEAGFPEMWRETGDGHVCKSATIEEAATITASSANSIAVGNGDAYVYSEPKIDKNKPKPKVTYVKLTPKLIVITCRCGGELECVSGITRGMSPTVWKHKCTKCSTWYELKDQAGAIFYE